MKIKSKNQKTRMEGKVKQPARTFGDLIVWQRAHALVLRIYEMTRRFPKEELYGLTSQVRRSAVSVPANIAEGFCRKSAPEKVRFLNIAHSSLEETRYYLILTQDLGYAPTAPLMGAVEEVSKLLNAYSSTVASRA